MRILHPRIFPLLLGSIVLTISNGVLAAPVYRSPQAIAVAGDGKTLYVADKTAGLIAAACRMGAILADAPETQQNALFRFGQYLGIAFQVADDTLDYIANGESLGKTIGQDLRQGKATLPLLHLLQHLPQIAMIWLSVNLMPSIMFRTTMKLSWVKNPSIGVTLS